ncbi:MAG: cytochrome ubiquinol oxidase subunit I [candidate division KSB1 bacterium]|nr:cytochrome ubiquinol oxidase subunit I [candidate division KSB1 bacterium]
MDLPAIRVPVLGASGFMAIVMLLHMIVFANFVVGGPVLAVITEYLSLRRKDPRFDLFARHLANMLFVAMVLGPVLGVGIVALNTGLFPRFFTTGVRVFFWPLAAEIVAFLLEAIFIVAYKYTWDRLRDRRGLHMSLGLLGALGSWSSMALINGLASFLLTPGRWVQTRRTVDAVFNPSFLPSLLHRAVASLSLAAFFMVGYSLYMRKREPEPGYAAWALRYAGLWAVVTTSLQFVPGVWYLQKLPAEVWAKFLAGPLTPYWFGGILLAAAAILILYYATHHASRALACPAVRGAMWLSILMVVATTWLMGFSRERARKPYLIYGVMYGNQQWVQAEAPSQEAGAVDAKALFRTHCAACHPAIGGDPFTKARQYPTSDSLAAFLRDPAAHGKPNMPPFDGTAEELQALVEHLRTGGE